MTTGTTRNQTEDYLAQDIMDRRRQKVDAERRRAYASEVETQKKRDGGDDLRPLMRHALKLWIFIGWAIIILSVLGIIAHFVRLSARA